MRGDMQETAFRALRLKLTRGGLLSDEQFRMRKQGGHRLHLAQNVGGPLVRDTHDQRDGLFTLRLFLAESEYGCAWRVGDGVGLTQIVVFVSQSVEGKEVQSTVRHENQVSGVEVFQKWSKQLVAERFQMGLCGIQQRPLETRGVRDSHSKL